jgi:ArsR family transcriptional regulator, arsenate/arsenite/antimonite-responsive transcriptional repressor
MSDSNIIAVLKALSDPTRLDIVRQLYREKSGAPCSEVCARTALSQPAVSHHMHKLVDAGVVDEHKAGKEKFYDLNVDTLEACGIDASKL